MNSYPVLVAVGIVAVVVFLIPVYKLATPYFEYNGLVPEIVPPFDETSNVILALFIVIAVSAVVALATVELVKVPSDAYTRHEYHLWPT